MEKVDAVSEEDISRVAADIFKREKLNLAVVGPYDPHAYGQKLVELLNSI
jgi:predicted Zn-dependent peptidase